jgi:hypothetical protein
MKRKEFEATLFSVKAELENRIKSAPIPAFFSGIIIGIVATIFRGMVGWIIFLGIAILAVVWLMGESEGESSKDDGVPPSSGNGGPSSGSAE